MNPYQQSSSLKVVALAYLLIKLKTILLIQMTSEKLEITWKKNKSYHWKNEILERQSCTKIR